MRLVICGNRLCSKSFYVPDCRRDRRYCSRKCSFIRRWQNGEFKDLNKNTTWETRERKRLSMLGKNKGSKHGLWKGNAAGYSAVHRWVRRNKPKPDYCEICHKRADVDLANITGVYKRDFNNWMYQCHECHMQWHYDNTRWQRRDMITGQFI